MSKPGNREQHYRWKDLPETPPPAPSRHGQSWSADDDELLRQYYTTHGGLYTAAILGRTVKATRKRATDLKVPGFEILRWDTDEVSDMHHGSPDSLTRMQRRFIISHIDDLSMEEIARRLQIAVVTIQELAASIGKAPEQLKSQWSRADDRFLLCNAETMTVTELARRLRRRPSEVHHRSTALGIIRTRRTWTSEEDALLRSLHAASSLDELSRRLKRTRSAIGTRIKKLGLRGTHQRTTMWSEEEDARLKMLYGTTDNRELSRQLGRSVKAIWTRAQTLGISADKWSDEERQLLIELHGTMTNREIARRIGRPVHAIESQVSVLGLGRKRSSGWKQWTTDEDAELRKLYGTRSNEELGRHFHCSADVVGHHARLLGLTSPGSRRWTPEEDHTLRSHYPTTSVAELATKLDRTKNAIMIRAQRLGLRQRK